MTLSELLAATAVLALLGGAMGTLAYCVQNANEYCQQETTASQHARVVLQRIRQNLENAKANETFPGCVVLSTSVGSYTFPDRLLIWRSDGVPANATEYPKESDLIVYTYDPKVPNHLLEVTTANTSKLSDLTPVGLSIFVDSLLSSPSSTTTVVTDQLHVATTTGGLPLGVPGDPGARGAIRFRVVMSPSESQWSEYRAGTRTWSDIDWPLDLYGSRMGMRRVSCQTEIQLRTDEEGSEPPLPFYGSATKIYSLAK